MRHVTSRRYSILSGSFGSFLQAGAQKYSTVIKIIRVNMCECAVFL